jgi:hypothetical protein
MSDKPRPEFQCRHEGHAEWSDCAFPTEPNFLPGLEYRVKPTPPGPKPLPCPFCGAFALPDMSGCGRIYVWHDPHCALWAAHSMEYNAAAWDRRVLCLQCSSIPNIRETYTGQREDAAHARLIEAKTEIATLSKTLREVEVSRDKYHERARIAEGQNEACRKRFVNAEQRCLHLESQLKAERQPHDLTRDQAISERDKAKHDLAAMTSRLTMARSDYMAAVGRLNGEYAERVAEIEVLTKCRNEATEALREGEKDQRCEGGWVIISRTAWNKALHILEG